MSDDLREIVLVVAAGPAVVVALVALPSLIAAATGWLRGGRRS